MKNKLLLLASLFVCSCTTYGPVRPTVTPYNTGYLNPWGFGTSGSYGGGYYPVYSGAWGNFNGWNTKGSVYNTYCR